MNEQNINFPEAPVLMRGHLKGSQQLVLANKFPLDSEIIKFPLLSHDKAHFVI